MISFLIAVSVSAAFADSKGLELAKSVYNRPQGKDSVAQMEMILKAPGSETRTRHLYLFARRPKSKHIETLLRFISPADIKETGLLTIDYPGDKTDQWIFLPGLKRSQMISASRKSGRFVSSDFFYEDLRDREVDADTHTFKGREKLRGHSVSVLESLPKDKSDSTYAKRVAYIDATSKIPMEIRFFGTTGKMIKKLVVDKIEKINGVWTPMKTTMYDLENQSHTELITRKIRYNVGLPDKMFKKMSLENPQLEKRFL